MGPTWYRTRRELHAHWVRPLATAVVVAAVGGLVLTLIAGVLRTLSASERYSAAVEGSYDVALEQFSGRPRVDEIRALPAVTRAEAATFVFAGMFVDGGPDPVEGFVFAGSASAFGGRVISGREPDPAAAGEFVATRIWVAETKAQLGDQFQMLTITQEQADANGFDVAEPGGPTVAATLVGVIDGPFELEDSTPLVMFPVAMLDVGDVGVASSVGVVALEPSATIDDLRAQLDTLPQGEVFGLDQLEWVPADVRAAARAQGQGWGVVAAIVAVAAIAVAGQLLSRRARLPAGHKLAMSAMGFTRAQIVEDQLWVTALPVAVGSLTAALLAFVASGVFPMGFARRVEPSPGLRFDALVHGGGALVFAALLVAWVLVAVLVGERERPALHRARLVDGLTSRFRAGPAATGVRFAFTRDARDPGSVRAPIMGLVLVVTVLIGALAFGSSVGRFVDDPARYGSNFDFATGMGGDTVPQEVRDLVEQDPDVEAVTLYGTLLANVGSISLDITGMQQVRGTLEPDVLTGRLARRADEMVLGRVAARQLHVGVGDEVVVDGADGPATFRITGLAVIPSIEGGDGIGEGGVVTFEGLRRIDPAKGLSAAAVRLRPGATGAAARISKELGIRIGLPDKPSTVVNLERVRSTPWIVAGSLAALAVLSISHQLLTSARRRRRDLAVLSALGADRRWVTGVLHWQATVLAVAVTALAVPLGIGFGRLVYQAYMDRIGARTDLSIPVVLLALVAIGLLVLGNVAALLPARRVRHEAPATVLADE